MLAGTHDEVTAGLHNWVDDAVVKPEGADDRKLIDIKTIAIAAC